MKPPFFYHVITQVYFLVIRLAALFNTKAKKWIDGRKDIFQIIEQSLSKNETRIWIHCASLGEFEQGRPIIEALKRKNKNLKIVLTFFSPSGYETRKDYEYADYIFYLPADSPNNAKQFIQLIRPELALFIKYEHWLYYLKELNQNHIPVMLVSAIFRNAQLYFKWYNPLSIEIFSLYQTIFVQDQYSATLLTNANVQSQIIISGDTRMDRVASIQKSDFELEKIRQFKQASTLLVAGSTWTKDEELLINFVNYYLPENFKVIIAPHEIGHAHIENIIQKINHPVHRYTSATDDLSANILILDTIGLLSRTYKYADYAYVGGGFGKEIHNILEPAVFGIPIFFGPNYKTFKEAEDLIALEASFSINKIEAFYSKLFLLQNDTHLYQEVCQKTKQYIESHTGATEKIIEYLSSTYDL